MCVYKNLVIVTEIAVFGAALLADMAADIKPIVCG
jgi:hypothetical protein